jgi:hypothetical protein
MPNINIKIEDGKRQKKIVVIFPTSILLKYIPVENAWKALHAAPRKKSVKPIGEASGILK